MYDSSKFLYQTNAIFISEKYKITKEQINLFVIK